MDGNINSGGTQEEEDWIAEKIKVEQILMAGDLNENGLMIVSKHLERHPEDHDSRARARARMGYLVKDKERLGVITEGNMFILRQMIEIDPILVVLLKDKRLHKNGKLHQFTNVHVDNNGKLRYELQEYVAESNDGCLGTAAAIVIAILKLFNS